MNQAYTVTVSRVNKKKNHHRLVFLPLLPSIFNESAVSRIMPTKEMEQSKFKNKQTKQKNFKNMETEP